MTPTATSRTSAGRRGAIVAPHAVAIASQLGVTGEPEALVTCHGTHGARRLGGGSTVLRGHTAACDGWEGRAGPRWNDNIDN